MLYISQPTHRKSGGAFKPARFAGCKETGAGGGGVEKEGPHLPRLGGTALERAWSRGKVRSSAQSLLTPSKARCSAESGIVWGFSVRLGFSTLESSVRGAVGREAAAAAAPGRPLGTGRAGTEGRESGEPSPTPGPPPTYTRAATWSGSERG